MLFGSYRIEWELGHGPFGRTYRARHADVPSLQVALKVLEQGVVSDERFMRSLDAELDKLALVHHPGVADPRGLVRDGDRVGLVTGLVDGEDVRHVFAEHRPSSDELAVFLEQALVALDVLHRQDLLHLDLCPSNVARTRGGRFVLLDSGMGRARHDATRSDLDRCRYRPPELSIGDVSPRSDLYQIGLTAWEIAVGRPACPHSDPSEALAWHRTVGIEDVRVERPELMGWLGAFIGRLCAPNASLRPHRVVDALGLLCAARVESTPSRSETAVNAVNRPTLVPVKR